MVDAVALEAAAKQRWNRLGLPMYKNQKKAYPDWDEMSPQDPDREEWLTN